MSSTQPLSAQIPYLEIALVAIRLMDISAMIRSSAVLSH